MRAPERAPRNQERARLPPHPPSRARRPGSARCWRIVSRLPYIYLVPAPGEGGRGSGGGPLGTGPASPPIGRRQVGGAMESRPHLSAPLSGSVLFLIFSPPPQKKKPPRPKSIALWGGREMFAAAGRLFAWLGGRDSSSQAPCGPKQSRGPKPSRLEIRATPGPAPKSLLLPWGLPRRVQVRRRPGCRSNLGHRLTSDAPPGGTEPLKA